MWQTFPIKIIKNTTEHYICTIIKPDGIRLAGQYGKLVCTQNPGNCS